MAMLKPGAKIQITLPDLHDDQWRVRDAVEKAKARYTCLACGRRWGKTVLGIDLAIETALDGKAPAAWVAPTYKLLLESWSETIRLLRPVTQRSSVQEKRIELVTGGVVEFWTGEDKDVCRGRKYKRVIIDEAAMIPNLLEIWTRAIRASLADYAGDAWFLSTPRGRDGFWRMYQRGLPGDYQEDGYVSLTAPTSKNPYIRASELVELKRTLPPTDYRQEILAEFIDDEGAVFRGVEAMAVGARGEYIPGHLYVIGVDWGRVDDATVMSIIDTSTHPRRQVWIEVLNKIGYEAQLPVLKELIATWKPIAVWAERNSIGLPLIERLEAEGYEIYGFKTTVGSKQALVDSLQLAIERKDLILLDDQMQTHELLAYQGKRLELSGTMHYSAPEGSHDDRVMALLLANKAGESPEMLMETISPESLIAGELTPAEAAWLKGTERLIARR